MTRHDMKRIRAALHKHHKEHGKVPSKNSGAADSYVGYQTTWAAVDQWLKYNGHGSLSQLCREMGFDPRYALHSLEAIQKGTQKYHKEHGKTPISRSGDATLYVGYQTTWLGIDQWLRNNGHGSLSGLCKEMGFDPLCAPHNLKAIKVGIRKFYKEHGKAPSALAGDASLYVGYKTTWAAVNSWLRTNGHESLSQICKELGFGARATHDLEAIKDGIRKYHKEHGKTPVTRSGEALHYVGYETTWKNIADFLARQGASLVQTSTGPGKSVVNSACLDNDKESTND